MELICARPLNQIGALHCLNERVSGLRNLALVIRPPERSTRLFLVSDDKERTPMEGFEVWGSLSRGSDRR